MGEVSKVDTFQPASAQGTPPAPEKVQAMVQQARTGVTRVEGVAPVDAKKTTPAEAPKGDRPAWLPEKFKTAEDLAKAYGELEKKQGTKAPEAVKPGTDPLAIPDKPADAPAEAADKAVEAAGLKMDELQAEFAQKGELSKDSLSKLEKVGIPKSLVDSFIEGQKAIGERLHAEVTGVAGGPEKFDAMREWSIGNLSAGEKEAFNAALASNNLDLVKVAVSGIHAKWVAAVGKDPGVRLHGETKGTVSDIYTHRDQLLADQRSKQYKTDQAFRDHVAAKLKRSNIL